MHHPLRTTAALTLIAAALALAACDRAAPVKPGSGTPTWKQGEAPVASAGLTVSKLATGLMHPRAVYPLPNGDILIVELKAVEKLAPIHEAQVISYLKMTKNTLGLLINFNVPILKEGIKRIILSS